jgi:hypothetical protein
MYEYKKNPSLNDDFKEAELGRGVWSPSALRKEIPKVNWREMLYSFPHSQAVINPDPLSLGDVMVSRDRVEQLIQNTLLTQRQEIVKKLKPFVERVRLDVDVIICDCGEPYKDSDLDLSLGELEKELSDLSERINKL